MKGKLGKVKGKFVVIIGPSACGKTTLVQELIKKIPDSARLITSTTRDRRPNEENGVHYFFITRDEFESEIKRGDFFEHAEVYGNLYGSSRRVLDSFLEKFEYVFAIIDVQGAETLKTKLPDSFTIFIRPGSLHDLEERIIKVRPEMSKEEMKKRIDTAAYEMSFASEFDAIVDNIEGHLDDTVEAVVKIIKNNKETAHPRNKVS